MGAYCEVCGRALTSSERKHLASDVDFVEHGEPAHLIRTGRHAITYMKTRERENEARAERASRTLDKAGDAYSSDREEAAVDLMTDLLHMLDAWYGTEPEAAHRMAWHHFMAEKVPH